MYIICISSLNYLYDYNNTICEDNSTNINKSQKFPKLVFFGEEESDTGENPAVLVSGVADRHLELREEFFSCGCEVDGHCDGAIRVVRISRRRWRKADAHVLRGRQLAALGRRFLQGAALEGRALQEQSREHAGQRTVVLHATEVLLPRANHFYLVDRSVEAAGRLLAQGVNECSGVEQVVERDRAGEKSRTAALCERGFPFREGESLSNKLSEPRLGLLGTTVPVLLVFLRNRSLEEIGRGDLNSRGK